jgi:hypothetical protein
MTLHVVGTVARTFGPSWAEVWGQRYDLTLMAYLSALDLQRLDGLHARHARLDAGVLTNLGMANVEGLRRAVESFDTVLRRGVRRDGMPPEVLRTFPGMPDYRKPVS